MKILKKKSQVYGPCGIIGFATYTLVIPLFERKIGSEIL
jgi:hypothetical protein